MKELRERPELGVTLTEFPNSKNLGQKPSHVYSLGPLSAETIAECEKALRRRHELLDPSKLRAAGELYARAAFRHVRDNGADWFGRIPNIGSLGEHEIPGTTRKGDLVIPFRNDIGEWHSLLVESKNNRQRFDLNDPLFAKLLEAAHAGGMTPCLIAAHLSQRAIAFCNEIGIAVLHLKRRLIPNTDRREIQRLWPNIGPEMFLPIRPDRIFEKGRIRWESGPHLFTVGDREWLMRAHRAWQRNRDLVPMMISALKTHDWKTVNFLRKKLVVRAMVRRDQMRQGFRLSLKLA